MIRKHLRELSVAAATGGLLLLLAVLRPQFFSSQNLRDILVGKAYVLVVAIGMTMVILAREIDISVGSQFAITGVVASVLSKAGVPLPLLIVGTLAAGAILGGLNGLLVSGFRLPSIVVTLATMVTLEQGIRWITGGEPVRNAPSFQWLGLGQSAGEVLVLATAASVLGLFAGGLRYLQLGRAVYALGSDPEAARLAGIRPGRMVFGVFVVMGILTALAAILNGIQSTQGDPTSGQGLGLQAIAAVVVGGTAISGGRGTLLGTLVGFVLLGVIGPALVFLQVEASWEKAIQGAIILVAVASDALNLRQRRNVGASLAAH
ncbi:MAG TPA: ABC transporter permease [Planctomycetota bacterium]|jgi:rhamnose transport system permease protein|nr:ABC transporter permease [Planctomycetota bacterium]